MGRLTPSRREHNHAAVRAAMERLLAGDLPPGGRCDLRTLAREAGVPRTGFYAKGDRRGPYQDLAEEFARRRDQNQAQLQHADPRDARLARLTAENAALRHRLADQDTELKDLRQQRTLALSRLAAQHDEIVMLRAAAPVIRLRHVDDPALP